MKQDVPGAPTPILPTPILLRTGKGSEKIDEYLLPYMNTIEYFKIFFVLLEKISWPI